MNLTSFTHQQALMVLNEIATMQAAHEAEIRAKDEIIAYYRRAAEMATRSKHRALDRKDEQRKDIIAWGIFIFFIVTTLILAIVAGHEFLLWSSGR